MNFRSSLRPESGGPDKEGVEDQDKRNIKSEPLRMRRPTRLGSSG